MRSQERLANTISFMSTPATAAVHHYRWDSVDKKEVTPGIVRQFISGSRLSVAKFSLARGTSVPSHAHENEQVSYVVRGALNTIQATAPGMAAGRFGRVINIGTNLFQNPVVPYHDYTAAKAALLSLTRTAAGDLGPDGITVNMVSGGLLRTTDASAATPEAVFDLIAGMTPLRSVTTPEEFADAVLFFASPWSRAVTGQNLVVDGGLVRD